ncbi:unnamed protein product [Paramecium sonneborni]|uniref:Uncharacterized protein n=1 Tax=Paramecium sonneborni TaxID=65129 RepID=A0A8S1NSI5_9CILI|nr:unnamed protein product [Paramecium sonneborni]
MYDVNYEDKPLQNYKNFLRILYIEEQEQRLYQIAFKLTLLTDSKVLSFYEVKHNSLILLKNIQYKLEYFWQKIEI